MRLDPTFLLRRARFRSRLLRRGVVTARQRDLKPADGILVSYPRSGTTWLRFLLADALTGGGAEFDPEQQPIRYLGDHIGSPAVLPGGGRMVYSHETLRAGDRRIVYIIRDPRGVALSEHRWLVRRGLASPDLERFLRDFVSGRSNPWGRWDRHVRTWLARDADHAGHLLLVRFEQLKAETERTLDGVVRFLGGDPSREEIARAVAGSSLDRMKEKEERAPDRAFAKGVDRDVRFVGSGESKGWRQTLTSAQLALIQDAFGPTMRELGYELTDESTTSV